MDVVVSMMPSKRRKVYHRPNCVYVEKMKPGNRMMISEKLAISKRFCRCKYCGGLRGEVRTKEMIETWEKNTTFNQLREENRYLICADHYRLLEDLFEERD